MNQWDSQLEDDFSHWRVQWLMPKKEIHGIINDNGPGYECKWQTGPERMFSLFINTCGIYSLDNTCVLVGDSDFLEDLWVNSSNHRQQQIYIQQPILD